MVGLRTQDSRTYVDRHGLRAEISAGPMNYRDPASGAWQPIDNTLVPAAGGGYRNRANSVSVTLPADLGQGPVQVGTPAGTVGFSLAGAHGAAVVAGATATYAGALPGVTVAATAGASGLEETLTLASAAAAAAGFRYRLQLPAGLAATAAPGGGIRLADATGTAVAGFAPAWMEDAKGALHPVAQTAGAGTLALAADAAWLADPARAYPVVIDPGLTIAPALDCWITMMSPTASSCGSTSHVGVESIYWLRMPIQFSLASIPATANVLAASLQVCPRPSTAPAAPPPSAPTSSRIPGPAA